VLTPPRGQTAAVRQRLRARRIRKWEERDLRRALPSTTTTRIWGATAVVGRGLIAAGLLLFGFVAYQLWGTGIETARAQRALTTEFEQLLATTEPEITTPAVPTPPSESVTPAEPSSPATNEPPQVTLGAPVARLEIPRIDVDDIVVVGVGSDELQLGPGHFPDTVPPGHLGNSAIAGHRTTYGQPFRNVDRLQPGDEIRATTPEGTFTYRVTETRIVSPSDYFVVFTTNPNEAQLTLVSCHPVWSTAQRIIVSASLVPEESSPPRDPVRYKVQTDGDTDIASEPAFGDSQAAPAQEDTATTTPSVPAVTTPETTPGTTPDTTTPTAPAAPAEPITDAFADGWFHDRDAIPQLGLWGAMLILISLLAHRISVLVRRDLVGFALGVVPFSLALYYFFQNAHRLVPPGL
jgi:sortase A